MKKKHYHLSYTRCFQKSDNLSSFNYIFCIVLVNIRNIYVKYSHCGHIHFNYRKFVLTCNNHKIIVYIDTPGCYH